MRIVVTFYLGQNEDNSPEIASQIAEKVLQRGRGKGQYIYDLGEGEVQEIKHIFLQKFSASHKEQTSHERL